MTMINGISNFRGSLVFGIGVVLASTIAFSVEHRGQFFSAFGPREAVDISPLQLAPVSPRPLTANERQTAETAWAYFEHNTQAETGLANSVAGFSSTTMWDQASYLLGLIAAHRLGLVQRSEFDRRLVTALASLQRLPLFRSRLPNKAYNTTSLSMTDYSNADTSDGIGWSALDVARMLVPLSVVIRHYPAHGPAAAAVLNRWDLTALVRDGKFLGARINDANGETEFVQEGRLGYEEYAARAALLLGVDALAAADYVDFIDFVDVGGVEIAYDSRNPDIFGANNYVVSEPYLLTGFEFGLDRSAAELAYRVYLAQEKRFEALGQLTAASEDHLDQPPFFAYYSVFSNGRKWTAMSEDGDQDDALRTISTKAAFGWHALYETKYTELLVDALGSVHSERDGWFAGLYEIDMRVNAVATANTNGIILEALHFRAFGPFLQNVQTP